jgi:hypothetical protein
VVEFIERDADYAKEMIKRGAMFWECVRARVPPVELPAVPPPADANTEYDMTGNNEWGNSAVQWLVHREAARSYEDAAKILKSLVPPDAKKCRGNGVVITRDRAGRLSLREDTP